jgi:hypothetical protein
MEAARGIPSSAGPALALLRSGRFLHHKRRALRLIRELLEIWDKSRRAVLAG